MFTFYLIIVLGPTQEQRIRRPVVLLYPFHEGIDSAVLIRTTRRRILEKFCNMDLFAGHWPSAVLLDDDGVMSLARKCNLIVLFLETARFLSVIIGNSIAVWLEYFNV